MKARVLIGLIICLCLSAGAQTPPVHDRGYWQAILRNDGAVPGNESAVELARELNDYVASPDPELRDDFAYTILATWIGRGILPQEELGSLAGQWRANLRDHIGESGTDSIYRRSFSALLLAEIVSRDAQAPFLGPEGFRSTLDATLAYLRDERDLRGYDESKGWAHATAHTADLLRACAMHPQLTRADQARVLSAITTRLATAGQVFTHSEPDRLAQAAAAMVGRDDFDGERFAAWAAQLRKSADSAFAAHPPRENGLATRENNLLLLRSLYVHLSLGAASEPRKQAAESVLAALRRRAG